MTFSLYGEVLWRRADAALTLLRSSYYTELTGVTKKNPVHLSLQIFFKTFPSDKLRAVLTENLCYSFATWDTSNLLDEETRGDYFLRFKLVIKNATKEG